MNTHADLEESPHINPDTTTRQAQPLHYDIKHVDFRNLLTVVMGRVSNQTGESFDSATLRAKSADEIWRRYNETKAHAEKLAELCSRLTDLLGKHSLTPHENGKPGHDLCVEGKYLLVVQEAKAVLAAWEEDQ